MTQQDKAIKNMYVAALLQAFKDAMRDNSLLRYPDGMDALETHRSRKYLTEYSEDLDIVCQIAQVDIDVLMKTANDFKAANWQFTGQRKNTNRFKGGTGIANKNRNTALTRMVAR